jgi:hypothetical protein
MVGLWRCPNDRVGFGFITRVRLHSVLSQAPFAHLFETRRNRRGARPYFSSVTFFVCTTSSVVNRHKYVPLATGILCASVPSHSTA